MGYELWSQTDGVMNLTTTTYQLWDFKALFNFFVPSLPNLPKETEIALFS